MKALIIVDVQNDFCQGGTLEVRESNSIFPFINQLIQHEDFKLIFVTKDWHPENHISFAVNHGKNPFDIIKDEQGEEQVLWPVHCVEFSYGAQLCPLLNVQSKETIEILKGVNANEESYSGFGTMKNPTKLAEQLKKNEVREIVIVGLALDYCVGSTALDAIKYGFNVTVIKEATKAVSEETGKEMYEKLEKRGVKYIEFKVYSDEGGRTIGSSDESEN